MEWQTGDLRANEKGLEPREGTRARWRETKLCERVGGEKGARYDGRDVTRGHRQAWGEKLWGGQGGKGTGTGLGGTGVGRDRSRLRTGVGRDRSRLRGLDSRALPHRTRLLENVGTWGNVFGNRGRIESIRARKRRSQRGRRINCGGQTRRIRGRRERKQCAGVLGIIVLRHEADPSRDLRVRKGRKIIGAPLKSLCKRTPETSRSGPRVAHPQAR